MLLKVVQCRRIATVVGLLLPLLLQYVRLLLDFFHVLLHLVEHRKGRLLVIKLIVLSHNVCDALHNTIELQCDTNGLSHVVGVLDAHANQFSNLLELALIRFIDLLFIGLVDELDDAVWLSCGLSGHGLAINWTDHEVAYISDLGLVVNFIDEAGLLLGIVAHNNISRSEHRA